MTSGSIKEEQIGKRKKKITQCTAMQIANAFALILLGSISDRRRLGTGPAPRANAKTHLHCPFNI